MFIGFPSIESFYHVRKNVLKYNWPSAVRYQAKVKLHGTNAAIQLRPDGTIVAQSRSRIINAADDNMGFAKYVSETENYWKEALLPTIRYLHKPVIVYGEWFGKGIMKGVACSNLDSKYFAPFVIQIGDEEDAVWSVSNFEKYKNIPGVVLLPFFGKPIDVYFDSDLESTIQKMNEMVEEVEACDPFIKENFGVEGIGEGLVFNPIKSLDGGFDHRDQFKRYIFKAKGEKHKTVKTRKAVQLDPEIASSIQDFANKVVTEARLEQAVRESNAGDLNFDMKKIGPFIAWLGKDVKKETEAELEASGLAWKQVQKAVNDKAVAWYKTNLEK